jgi:DNA-binding response OmpR family regulator
MKSRELLQAGKPAGTAIQRQTNPPHRILVVEDDRDVRRASAQALMNSGYHVEAAEDGAAAWEILQTRNFNLLITDNNMPKLTGVELVRKLRSARMALPVILATGKLPAEALAPNPSFQLAALLPKPFYISELLDTVKKVLSGADRATADSQPFRHRDMNDNKKIAPAEEPAGAPRPRPANSPYRILVVDDDPYLCHLSAEVLIRHGYQVNAAGDGAAAWEELNANRYDLLITDNNMPRLTGVELIRKLRSACMALPVIMATTGRLPAEVLGQNPPLLLAAMLPKPFHIVELLETVKKVLSEADRATAGSQPFKQRDMNDNKIAPAGEPAGAPRPRPANSPFRILVVDDDKDTRQNSFDVLVACGYDVAAVKDGAAGWEALQSCNYDLIITDNKMPRMTGIEMIEKLRLARMTLPVIMATRYLPVNAFARQPWLTPDAMLQRPFSNDDLLEAVKNVLRPDDTPHEHSTSS